MIAVINKTKRILIVEDDQEMQQIYRDMFQDKQDRYEIEFGNNAALASRKLEEKTFDLIILDIIMEPVPGDSLFVYIRKTKMITTPILVVSVLSPELLRNLKKINHVDFLKKPIKEEELFERIEKMTA